MVFCRGCGKSIHETAVSCPHCGALQQGPASAPSEGTLWLPVPALLLGLVAFLALFDETDWDTDTYVGVFMFIVVALILGGVALATQKRGTGMAIAGV